MLKRIPAILSPELLKVLCQMGHSNTIVTADGKFPSVDVYKKLVSDVDECGEAAFCRAEPFEFFEHAKKAYAFLATGKTAIYSNIMLQKGVVVA